MYALKNRAEKFIPRKYLRVVGLYITRTMSIFMRGKKLLCPCCGYQGNRFLSYGLRPRPNALCPWCLSLERHRLLWLYLDEKSTIYTKPTKILHFAPEHQLQIHMKSKQNIDYTSADLDMPTAMIKMDITNITFSGNTFDFILCNHVLEHIPDDHKAMSEIYRVLKPGGWAILQTPMNYNSAITDEDITISDPHEMEKRFGQNDHVRIYGLDKKNRLESAGFRVVIDTYVKDMPIEKCKHHALDNTEDIYCCYKD